MDKSIRRIDIVFGTGAIVHLEVVGVDVAAAPAARTVPRSLIREIERLIQSGGVHTRDSIMLALEHKMPARKNREQKLGYLSVMLTKLKREGKIQHIGQGQWMGAA